MCDEAAKPAGFRHAYIRGTHRHMFRSGEPGKIIAFESVRPDRGSPWRPAFRVEYADGREDWIALESVIAGHAEVLDGDAVRMAFTA